MRFQHSWLCFGWIVGIGLVLPAGARAGFLELGLDAGATLSQVGTTNLSSAAPGVVVLSSENLSGFSYAGTASLGLFGNSLLGFEVAADYLGMNASNGADNFQGQLAIASASAHFTFNALAHFHQIGVGYAHANLLNPSTTPAAGVPTTMNGLVVVGKDYLIVNWRTGPFLEARFFAFVPGGLYNPVTAVTLQLGFDL